MDRGGWPATVLRVAKSPTWLKRLSVHAHVLAWKVKTAENSTKLIISSERPILTKVFHSYLELFRKVFAGSREQIKYLTKIWRVCVFSWVGLFASICSLPGSLVHGDSPGKNPGVGCYVLPQRIFPTQGLNQSLSQAGKFFSTSGTWENGATFYMEEYVCMEQWEEIHVLTFQKRSTC